MGESHTGRRNFLADAMLATGMLSGACNRAGRPNASAAKETPPGGPPDVTLRIGAVLADIAKEHTISTVGYNGTVPGPLIRLREGVPVTVDLFNDTDTP